MYNLPFTMYNFHFVQFIAIAHQAKASSHLQCTIPYAHHLQCTILNVHQISFFILDTLYKRGKGHFLAYSRLPECVSYPL